MTSVVHSWAGTPYFSGHESKGIGVDCIRFVLAVVDEMDGVQRDRSAHFPLTIGRAAMRPLLEYLEQYDYSEVESPEDGDIVIMRPFHAGISLGGIFWHADRIAGVCFTGLPPALTIIRPDKSRW